jgi:alpha-beta hydrolase superfamily lysophospholipase
MVDDANEVRGSPTSGSFTGAAGGEIFWQRWPANGEPKAAVVLAHGVSEHSDRYAHVAARLNSAGYDVWALDHRGHGRSQGGRANIDRMGSAVADVVTVIGMAREQAPERRLFLLGHSMGGAIALQLALDHPAEIDGLVLSAPAAALEAASRLELAAGRVLSAVVPNAGVFDVNADAVSRDPEVVREYVEDPRVHHGRLPARTVAELAHSIEHFEQRVPELRMPLLVMLGTGDRLVPPAAGRMVHAGADSADKELIEYEGLYHEILNEPEQQQVMDDLVRWLDAHQAA